MRQKQSVFGRVLTEAIQEGLNSIGPSISDAVLFYVQKKAAIRFDQHDLDPHTFDDCLKSIFGCGAEIVERKILECLYLRLEVQVKIKSGFAFADEVKKAQKLSDSSDLSTFQSQSEPGNVHKPVRKALLVNNR